MWGHGAGLAPDYHRPRVRGHGIYQFMWLFNIVDAARGRDEAAKRDYQEATP